MSNTISRRASLRSLAVVGVGMATGVAADASASPEEQAPLDHQEVEPAASAIDVAVARLTREQTHSCAQAVFSAFAEQMGMDHQTAIKLSSGFGGGMHLGGPCGAVSGAIMAIGLKHGGLYPNTQAAELVQVFAERFRAKHRSINCPELIGVDLGTPEGRAAAKDMKVFAGCPGFVEDAARILDAVLKEAEPKVTS